MTFHKSQSGFTLVELAVVMIIIGLLIGGILKGAELVASARVAQTIKTIESIRVYAQSFQLAYGTMPGDIATATTRIPGCDASNFCINGDGNGYVASNGGDNYNWRSALTNTGMMQESFQFWKHLALAGYLNGVQGSANPANPAFGETHPSSKYGGGFEFYYDGLMVAPNSSGHIARLSTAGFSGSSADVRPVVDVDAAAVIDRKLDNGQPNSGEILADYGPLQNECKRGTTIASEYRVDNERAGCILYFRMFRR